MHDYFTLLIGYIKAILYDGFFSMCNSYSLFMIYAEIIMLEHI